MTQRLVAQEVPGPRGGFAEGPFWDARTDELGWVDIPGGLLHLLDPRTGEQRTADVGEPLGAAVPHARGGWALAVAGGFAWLPALDLPVKPLVPVDDAGGTLRMNDGKCDPAGRFWAGTMAYDYESTPGAGSLYRLDLDGSVTQVLTGVTISNGLDWTPDGRTMYYVDSLAGGVDVLDVDPATGDVRNRRRLVDVDNDTSSAQGITVPDGLTLDRQGCLWVAVYGGQAVRRYAPDGQLLAVVELPGRVPTSCAFGGPGLDELYITCGDAGADGAPLLVCRPGVTGLPTRPFQG